MDLGATCRGGVTRFVVWAPKRTRVELVAGTKRYPLQALPGGYFEAEISLPAGTRYKYKLDGGDERPDPCSRFQPDGPHGASEVVDSTAYEWRTKNWKGVRLEGQVLYELHVGTFSAEGTWRGLMAKLPYLRDLGVTCLELMPVAAFPGRFNWGYDGVHLFAPCAVYGRPDDFRRLVDEAHALGLGVILDVVYNHLGPDGNYLRDFSADYFTDKYVGEWGDPVRFEDAPAVREFVIENVVHWVTEYRLDGLRLDATQSLHDASPQHIVAEIVQAARQAAHGRNIILIAESEPQDVRMLREHGADGLWVDDFHHSARVAATRTAEAYMQDYSGTARELLACALSNALYQGQYYSWQKNNRGWPLFEVAPAQIIFYLQNHDQVANSLSALRLHALVGARVARALTSYFLLVPQTPMLFAGQERFADTPFFYFCDHNPTLMVSVHKGRRDFLAQLPSVRSAFQEGADIAIGESAFTASKLDWTRVDERALLLHKTLLQLRREIVHGRPRGAVLGDRALALRYGDDYLLLLNLSEELSCPSEPLLAPPEKRRWVPLFSSEETRFGGAGAVYPQDNTLCRIQGASFTVMKGTKP